MTIYRLKDFNAIIDNAAISSVLALCMFNPTPGKIQNIAQSVYAKTQGVFYVLEVEGEVVGILGGSRIDNTHLTIRHMAVVPHMQRKGYGTALLDALLKEITLQTLEAETDDDAIGFYRKMGFKTKRKEDDLLDRVRYACTLNVSDLGKY